MAYLELIALQRANWRASMLKIAVVLVLIAVSLFYVGVFDLKRMAVGIPSIFGLIRESLPPNFEDLRSWVKPLLDTLAMSVAGTALAIGLSLPLGFLAARSTTLHPVACQTARGILNVLRSIPELIMGILFVAAVGFGALPGVLALGLHSVGMMGKFFSESIEHVDKEPIEAVKAAGANPMQVILHGFMPQVLPQFADVSLYRWEYNFRASTVMGMVGAGGIGTELMGSLRIMQYKDVSALLIIILAMVTLVDGIGMYLRKRFK